jgi:alpha-D-ribose 1-methylphosphonate 5-triphosphate synthase subunit PhnH
MRQAETVSGGAAEVFAAQSVFRAIMNATARPGSVQTVGPAAAHPAALSGAAAAIALTLFDHDTPVWLDPGLASDSDVAPWLRFRAGCPLVADPAASAFALVADATAAPSFNAFAPGTPDYPDRSTTLILHVGSLTQGPELSLTGPGIRGATRLRVAGLPDDFVARCEANRALFPRGLDLLLVRGHDVVALPRTTTIAGA